MGFQDATRTQLWTSLLSWGVILLLFAILRLTRRRTPSPANGLPGDRYRAPEQLQRQSVQVVPHRHRRFPGARAGMCALQDDAELEARQHRVPIHRTEIAVRAFRVMRDKLLRCGQAPA